VVVSVNSPAPPRLGPLSALAASVDALAGQDLDHLSSSALGDDLVSLRRQIDRLEAEHARRLHRFDRLHGPAAQGASSSVSWLVSRCRLSGGAAAQRLTLARRLPDLPHTQHALRRGDIGFHHAAVIAHAADQLGVDRVRPAENLLLDSARVLDPHGLRRVTRHLRHCLDPDGALRDADHDHRRRRLHLSRTLDGVLVLDGLLDPEGGATLLTAVDVLSAPLPGDTRTAAQRRADALVELCTRQLGGGALPRVAGQRPHLTVTTSLATLRGQPGAPAGELAGAGTIVAETVRRLACDAALTTLAVGPGGEPSGPGRAVRTVPPALRRAVVLRDRGCRFPGCDRPPAWCEVHHLVAWSAGGPTTLANLALLCRVHHRRVHEEGWRLVREPGGQLRAVPP
jgi:Domain of unknown function (DUF222)/HNH endonuclease